MNNERSSSKNVRDYGLFKRIPKIYFGIWGLAILLSAFLSEVSKNTTIALVLLLWLSIYSLSFYQFILVMRFSRLTGKHTSIKTFGYIILLLITFPGILMMNDAGKRIAYQMGWDTPPYIK